MTNIQWTDETWNPVTGCEKIAPGCKNCYADAEHKRRHKAYLAHGGVYPKTGKPMPAQYAKPFESVQLHPDRLDAPLRMRRGRRIFVCSGADLFHDDVPFEYIAAVFGVMAACPQHTFQVLTKRPERALEFMAWLATQHGEAPDYHCWGYAGKAGVVELDPDCYPSVGVKWPLPNVEFGVSLSDQGTADKNVPILLRIPAAVRFVSAEPLLGGVCMHPFLREQHEYELLRHGEDGDPAECDRCAGEGWVNYADHPETWGEDCPSQTDHPETCRECGGDGRTEWGRRLALAQESKLDWVIVGGESGPGARPCDVAWIRSIVSQCKAASVPVFVKQLGKYPVEDLSPDLVGQHPTVEGAPSSARAWERGDHGKRVRLSDPKGGTPQEWPADLRVREFPATASREGAKNREGAKESEVARGS